MKKMWPNGISWVMDLVRESKLMMENKNMGLGMLLHKRMKVLPERPIKNIKSLRKMLDKAKAMGKGGAV